MYPSLCQLTLYARQEASEVVGGKWVAVQKLTADEKKWLDANWSDYKQGGSGPPSNKKWKTIKKGDPDYDLLQVAKDEARRAVQLAASEAAQPSPASANDLLASPASSSTSSNSHTTSDTSDTSKIESVDPRNADMNATKSAIESDLPRVRARALLRATFGSKWWSFTNDPTSGKQVATPLHKARMKWAMEVLQNPEFDPLDLPEPPYGIWDTWMPKHKDNIMLPFAGPITGLRTSGTKPDGLDVVLHVKKCQSTYVVTTQPLPSTTITQIYDSDYMSKQKLMIIGIFQDFVKDVSDMGKKIENIIGKDNVGKMYTAGSGRFNRTLRIPNAKWEPYPNPKDVQERRTRVYDVWKALHEKDPSAPELASFEAFVTEGLARVHAMWRLLYITPRIKKTPVYVLRAVKSQQFLPHSLAGVVDPQPGMSFLDVGFVSTTVASPLKYWSMGNLSSFFDTGSKCCMMAIEVVAGTPMLPLFVKPDASVYQDEEEVVLPPLTVWVYLGHEVRADLYNTHVYSYRVHMLDQNS